MENVGVNNFEEECREMKMILRGIAHEMGNALTVMGYSIRNFAKREELKLDEDWNYISDDYNYICKLFKNLSAYNNSKDIKREKTDLNNIIKHVINGFEQEFSNNNVKIIYKNGQAAKILGDEVKLRQVFINIIKNAYEAVQSRDINERFGIIEVIMNTEIEDRYIVQIKDNGCGIKQENILKIFEPMYTSGKEGGTGLGLPVCKNIIESHNGRINVSSTLMRETIFEIELKKPQFC